MQLTLGVLVSALATAAFGHGIITKPATRTPGAATAAVCGQKMVTFYTQDNTSYPEALKRANGLDDPAYNPAKCDLYLCKGYQFADNAANVLKFAEGQTVDIEVSIRIPHKGYANVSVVDMAANKIIGSPLLTWPDGYADPAKFPNLPADQTKFSITVPKLDGKCVEPGACVCVLLPFVASPSTALSCSLADY